MRSRSALSATLLVFALLAGLAAPAEARKGRGAPTAPGKYTDWQNEIDQLEIVETFQLGDYGAVVIEPFDTSKTPLPEAGDNTVEPVKQVLADPSGPLAEGLRGKLGGKQVTVGQAPETGKVLAIRGVVVEMDPGSQAARYWGGFGAGAARTRLQGEVVDGETGEVLLRFDQERRSGVGLFGGDYVKLLQRNLRTIGEDLALVLNAF